MVEVRSLTCEDDLRGVVELSRVFFQEYESCHEYFFRIDRLLDEDITDYFKRFIDEEDHAAFVALEGDRTVGYISVRIQPRVRYWKVDRAGHISGLMVAADRRRRGIGTELLEVARAYFREQGVQYFTVCTATGNESGLEFYRRRGLTSLNKGLLGEV